MSERNRKPRPTGPSVGAAHGPQQQQRPQPSDDSGLFDVAERLTQREHELAARLIAAFAGLTQAGRVYDMYNAVVTQLLEEIAEIVADFRGAGVSLTMAGYSFFINRRLTRMDLRTYRKARMLREAWRAIELGEVALERGVGIPELRELATALDEAHKEREAGEARARLFDGRFAGLSVRRQLGDDSPGERRQPNEVVVRLYAALLVLSRRTLSRIESGKRPPLLRVKRTLQMMIEHVEQHEDLMVALATQPARRGELATHLVNCAVLSLALGHRAGLDRRALVGLMMCALFHDVPKHGLNELTLDSLEQPSRVGAEDRARVEQHWLGALRRLVELSGFADETVPRAVAMFESQLEFTRTDLYGGELASLPPLSLYSQLIRLADVVDSAGARRGGGPFIGVSRIISALAAQCVELGQPELAELLVHTFGLFPAGCMVLLDSGEAAVVVGQGLRADPARPVVSTVLDPQGGRVDGPRLDLAVETSRHIVAQLDPAALAINAARPLIGEIEAAP